MLAAAAERLFSWRASDRLAGVLAVTTSSFFALFDASLAVSDWQSATITPDWNDLKVRVRAERRSPTGSIGDRE
jgi:hypothetical protein